MKQGANFWSVVVLKWIARSTNADEMSAEIDTKKESGVSRDKWTKRGAIIGGIYGSLAYPLLIFLMSGGSSAAPLIGQVLATILYTMYLPAILAGKLGMDFGLFGFVIMVIGWSLIGTLIGHLYDKTRR